MKALCENKFNRWINSSIVDDDTKNELREISKDSQELEIRFEKNLTFGTSGLRSIMRAGTNGMNVYTVRHVTQALANMILAEVSNTGVVISYDSRHNSKSYAEETATVLAANGIKAYLFDNLRPTPELSFAVRHLKATSGVNITASHNTSEYNGYKVYWMDGGQMVPKYSNLVTAEMGKIDIFDDVKTIDFDEAVSQGLIESIGKEVDDAYIAAVLKESIGKEYVAKVTDDFKCVYTPFHGCGYWFVPEILSRIGIKNIIPVEEQMVLDGNFPTVKSPNPENTEGFDLALKYAEKSDADIIIGTDPDSDRCATIVRNESGEYYSLSGNQMGILLLHYVAEVNKQRGTLDANSFAIRSVVSSPMFDVICENYGIHVDYALTGFKYIAEKILDNERTGRYKYLFGYEESIGFLKGDYARDKDGISTAMIFAEMSCFYKAKGLSVYQGLQNLYAKYGYYEEGVHSFNFEGEDAYEKMSIAMDGVRKALPSKLGYDVKSVTDYKQGYLDFEPSDVLEFKLGEGSVAIIRPSGTEPKIKLYVYAHGENLNDGEEKVKIILKSVEKLIKNPKNI